MGREQYAVLKVFIASPGDVLPERRVAFRVVEEINRILASINKAYRLEVRAWEGHVHPDLGLPEEVILKQIPIEGCDLFIGIFWRRFGTPTGRRRPKDGKPYLSGTEEEIEKAIDARRKNPENRPIIMLYRKIDPLAREMTEEECRQYVHVMDYFEQFEPGGEHPALTFIFSESEFEDLLQEHLLRAITGLEDQERTENRGGRSGQATPQEYQEEDPQSKWLGRVGLTDNPFRYNVAGFERDKLPQYSVTFPGLGMRVQDLVRQQGPMVIFSDRGGGKSALRVMTASYCYPEKADSDSLCVELDQAEFKHVMGLVNGDLERLKPVHYVQAIVQLALDFLQRRGHQQTRDPVAQVAAVGRGPLFDTWDMYTKGVERLLVRLGKRHARHKEVLVYQLRLLENIKSARLYGESDEQKAELFRILDQLDQVALSALDVEFWTLCKEVTSNPSRAANDLSSQFETSLVELQWFVGIPPGELENPENELKACYWLKVLVNTSREFGFQQVVCLIDGIDEVPAVQNSRERMARLLTPVMVSALRENRGIAFRYFLPTFLRPVLAEQPEQFRLERLPATAMKTIKWSEPGLRRLIRQRMIFFSRDQVTPYQALGELCESENDFAEAVDDRLVALASGRPRAAIWLAGRLIELHCEVDEPPRLIKPVTWERVKSEWDREGRKRFLADPAQAAGPWLSDDRIFYMDQEITLSPRSHRLLSLLIRADGRVCSRPDLVGAGWPSENPAGVTDRAITEAIRRLRKELGDKGGDPSWVETVRGRGYRLRGPGKSDGKAEADASDLSA